MELRDRLSIRRPSAFDDHMNKRPLAVLLIGCVYIVTGAAGFAAHFSELNARHPFENDVAWVELVSLIALVSGAYLLRGHNWARAGAGLDGFPRDPEHLPHADRAGGARPIFRSPDVFSLPSGGHPLLSDCQSDAIEELAERY